MRRKFDPAHKAMLDSKERHPPEEIISLLPIKTDQSIADIGCGTGYYTIPLAKILTDGKVYAVDVSQEMLDALRGKLEKSTLRNVIIIKSEEDRIPLEAGSLDGAIMICVLHESAEDRAEFLEKVFDLIKPGGWLAVVEWIKKEMPFGPPLNERLNISEAIEMAPKKGVELLKQQVIGNQHYFLLWRKLDNKE